LLEQDWGGVTDLPILAPSRAADPAFAEWWATFLRMGASPSAALTLARTNTQIDTRAILPAVRVPTLVLHRRADRDSRVEEGRFIAAQIPNAKLRELEGQDHLIFVGDVDGVVDEIEEFLTGVRAAREADRVLATILFTDIVDSTAHAADLGDQRWQELLGQHDRLVRQEIERMRGREMNTTGDGFVATFDGPARAVRCALAAMAAVQRIGLQIRAGI